MCGIAGVIVPAGTVERYCPQRLINQMTVRLNHRGPDGRGTWNHSGEYHHLALGHTRLAILDLTDAARQPMVDPVSGCTLIYNGEVYNFAEIRNDLAKEGETFRSTGDTEVVLKACVRWGKAAIPRFRGMFAIALFDPNNSTLLLARDPFGMKPLYYTEDWSGCFAFSSEVRPLLDLPWARKRLDSIGLLGYLSYGSVQEPFTLVSGIQSLRPAHTMTIGLGRRNVVLNEPERYWQMPVRTLRERAVTRDEAAAGLRQVLAESVRLHMVSDVPIAAFLSGGVDSSAITALMCETAGARVQGLTVSFEGAGYDESGVARQVARAFGIEHVDIRLTADDLLSSWENWLGDQDQPGSDGANTWVISRACRRAGIRVALSGLGADEFFAGYSTFGRALTAQRWSKPVFCLPSSVRKRMALTIGGIKSMTAQKAADWLSTDGSLAACYLCLRRMMPKAILHQLLHPVSMNMSSMDLHPGVWNDLLRGATDCDPLSAVSLLEAGTYMVSTLMRDSDQMGMAHSLEIRMPFVDRNVAEAALALPGALHASEGPKTLLRRAMCDKLHPSWVNRPKEGFTVPFDRWLKQRLRPEVESILDSIPAFPFRPGSLRRTWKAFLQGDRSVSSSQILTLITLARWIERHDIQAEY
jgi:asparagine synthase (glutamine-hydrolysing)